MSAPPPSTGAPVSTDVIEIERALNHIVYLTGRARHHERRMALAGVTLDRAAVALLRQIAYSEPQRPGELAARLTVEASHVTRQVRQLQKAGYVTRVPDPDDRRAQRVQITPAGQKTMNRIRDASARSMWMTMADWSPRELRQFATFFNRMVDDLLSCATEEEDAEAHQLH